MNQWPGLVTLIPMALGVPSRDSAGALHFPIQVQAMCGQWKNDFKQPRSIHCDFGIIAWLSSTGSNGYRPCCFFPFWITSNNCLRDIKALSTAHNILQQLLEHGFLDVMDGLTLLCLTCLRAWIQFIAQRHTLTHYSCVPVLGPPTQLFEWPKSACAFSTPKCTWILLLGQGFP